MAFELRNISSRTDITHSFLQNRVNGRILRTVGLDSRLKTACIALSVENAKEMAFKRRNISSRTDITHSFLQNRVNGRILGTVGLYSTLKTACIAFGV